MTIVTTTTVESAMRRALELAASPGVPLWGPNPRVGCVLLADDGTTCSPRASKTASGTAHAEAAALAQWGASSRARRDGGRHPRAVQPHRPHGPAPRRSSRPAYAASCTRSRPEPPRCRGRRQTPAAGVEVEAGVLSDEAAALNGHSTSPSPAAGPG